MKAEINNENKAKFFAMYWGQEVLRFAIVDEKSPHAVNAEVDFNFYPQFKEYNRWSLQHSYLQLLSLSQISGEDAIALAKIVGVSQEDIDLGLRDDFREGFDEFLKEQLYPMKLVDYLRSRSYALPWMGLSVEEIIESGWIKLR